MKLKQVSKITGGVLTAAATLIGSFEGLRQIDYLDPVGIPTACVGHTGPDVHVGRFRTPKECRDLLSDDLKVAWDDVGDLVKVPLKPYQQVAFMSFVFNSGRGNFATSTMLKKLNKGDYVGACKELPKWIYAKGKVLPGLVVRRSVELRVCLGLPVPQIDIERLTE